MNDTFKFITQEIVAVLSAFLGAYCGYRFARLREIEVMKIAYRVKIRAIIAQIPPLGVPAFHAVSAVQVKDAVLGVLGYLREDKAISLTNLWKQYGDAANLGFGVREDDIGVELTREIRQLDKQLYESNAAKMQKWLEILERYSR